MDIEKKCSQCGCKDLEAVPFPYKSELVVASNECYANESIQYELNVSTMAGAYICTKCGHYEFYNDWLAKSILDKREEKIRTQNELQKELKNLDKQVSEKNNEIQNIEQELNSISTQLKSLDITIRQSKEFKVKQKELNQKLELLKNEYQELLKQQNNVKSRLD